MTHSLHFRPGLFVGLLLWFIVGCNTPADTETDIVGVGGSRPEIVAASFFDDFNAALQDPNITEPETRRAWAERLANYFAPSERAAQREVIGQNLATFAYGLTQLDERQRLVLAVDYTNVELIEQVENRANIRLINGKMHLQRIQTTEEGLERVVFDQERSLAEVIGQASDVFPVLRVNGRWFMTER